MVFLFIPVVLPSPDSPVAFIPDQGCIMNW